MYRHSITIKVCQDERGNLQVGGRPDQPMTAEEEEKSMACDLAMTMIWKATEVLLRVSRKIHKKKRPVVQPTASVMRPL